MDLGPYPSISAKVNWLKILFSNKCLVCGQKIESGFICQKCWDKLSFYNNQKGKCLYCQKPAVNNLTHYQCLTKRGLVGGVVAYNYNSVINRLIPKLKYRILNRGQEIFERLIDNWWPVRPKNIFSYWQKNKFFIQPVPITPNRYKWRGFNQTKILADIFQEKLGLKKVDWLIRTGLALPRIKMPLKERYRAIRGAYKLKEKEISKSNVLIIDDVLTTGSTLKEISQVLRRSGAKEVWYLVLAGQQRGVPYPFD